MDDKQIIIDGVNVKDCKRRKGKDNYCRYYKRPCSENNYNCIWKKYYRKEQECFQLANVYHCLVKIANHRLNKIEDLQQQLDQLKTENEELKRKITKIFVCLIKANKTNKIVDTIWVDNITTLWDYIALTLGIEGDQVQIEKQILQKINEVTNGTNP